MKYSYLKKIRTVTSLLFFFSIAVLFLDLSGALPPLIFDGILFLQFIPSLLSFTNAIALGAIGFIIIIFLTMVFGRVYCSSVCPLGTLQDAIIYIGRKIRKKRRFTHTSSLKIVRYSLLGAVVLSLLLGTSLLVNLLDPYSNFGRIFSDIVKPVVVFGNNILSGILESFNIFLVYPNKVKGFNWITFIYPVMIVGILLLMSIKKERLFCNTLCPVGALLGLLSKFSLYKISINEDDCTGCGLCEWVCKSNCIDKKAKSVDFERCVSCYNCLSVCPKDGVIFSSSLKKEIKYSSSKRDFIKNTAVYFIGLTGIAAAQVKIIPTKESTVPVKSKYPASPPGGGSTEHFNSYCTACHLCVSACPTGVLQPSFLEYGFTGMLQPRMDFIKGFCNYECKICLDVCPTEALIKKDLASKKLIQIGKVKFVKDNCIVETEKKDCGACSEHCPTKAVKMVPVQGANLMIPETDDQYCIGCGACEYACPTVPYKAIYVEASNIHGAAKKPKSEKIEEKIDLKEDFPF